MMPCCCKKFFKFFAKKFCIFEKYTYLCIRKTQNITIKVR
jgi:hypothetical protein